MANLLRRTHIKQLSLRSNRIDPRGIQALAHALHGSKLRLLDLSGNTMDQDTLALLESVSHELGIRICT